MSQKALMDLGVLKLQRNPGQVLSACLRTYKHPTTGMTVALHPIPNFAQAAYWSRAWYNVDEQCDRVLSEDGYGPVRAGTYDAYRATALGYLMPFVCQRQVVPTDARMAKYEVLSPTRDRLESAMAYESVKLATAGEPPVDPRARRAVDRLEAMALESNAPASVVVPWNVFHNAYFFWRLEQQGWTLLSTEDVKIVTQFDAAVMMLVGAFLSAMLSLMLFRTLVQLLFGW
jgi:hypothetical protein